MKENIIAKSRAEQSRAEQSRAEQSRNPYIQIIRALAIFAVVLIHTCPNGISQVIARPFINFGVGSFLFLSGFLTKESSWNTARMLKRIKRVLIPYIVWTVIYSARSLEKLPYNLITASSSAQMYYILVYVQLVLLTSLCIKGSKNKIVFGLLIFISPISFFIKYIQTFTSVSFPGVVNVVYGFCFLPWICYYMMGLFLIARKPKLKVGALIVLLLGSIILQFVEGYIWYKAGDSNCGTQMKVSSWITTTITCLIFYELIHRRRVKSNYRQNWIVKLLILIGDYSFGIYLCHIAVMMALGKIWIYNKVPYIVNSFVVLLVSFVLCFIGDLILRKFHFGKLSLSKALGLK